VVATELEIQGELIRLRSMLRSGRARQLVKDAGLTTVAVAEIIGVAQPNAWKYLAGEQFPRRAAALKLLHLLDQLEVVRDAS